MTISSPVARIFKRFLLSFGRSPSKYMFSGGRRLEGFGSTLFLKDGFTHKFLGKTINIMKYFLERL